jgi:hypothetical protein
MTRRLRITIATGAMLSAVALVAGCGSDSGDSASVGGEAASAPQADSGAGADEGGPAYATPGSGSGGAASGARDTAAQVVAQATKRVRTAQVTVEVKNLTTASAAVRQVATDLGGIVGSETTGYGAPATQPSIPGAQPGSQPGPAPTRATTGEAVITLRVPEPKLDVAMQRVSQTGKELTRTTTSEDVTATLADLGSRVATQQRSLERVRTLLARAGSVQEIVQIEAELSRREADLEALQARQRALTDQAALSTLTAILRLPSAEPLPEAEEDDTGFMAGLEAGWHALVVSTRVVLTVLGALLPPVTVIALLGVPLFLLWRRYRPARTPRPGPRTPRPGPPAPSAPPAP